MIVRSLFCHPRPNRPGIPVILILCLLLLPAASQHGASPVLNEFMASNGSTIADEDGDYEDWIELHNPTRTAIALQGYALSDDPERPFRWIFPNVHLAPGAHLIVWASGKDRANPQHPLHTNFRISAAGEPLLLTQPDGVLVDAVDPVHLPRDVSLGRQPDGTGDWHYFDEPTPGDPNLSIAYGQIAEPPLFSHSGGFHTEPFTLTLSSPDPHATILYTLDGSLPDPANLDGRTYHYKNQYPQNPGDPFGPLLTASYQTHLYSEPLPIVDRSPEPDRLTGRSSTWHRSPAHYTPLEPVFKGTVVRARSVREGALPSRTITHTFFVTPEGHNRYDLPVLALTIQEDHLFDYDDGIYVAGTEFDAWRAANTKSPSTWLSPANYRRRDAVFEYPAHLEMLRGGSGRVLALDLGVRLHGGASRQFPQKSLRLYPRKSYDEQATLDHRFFEGLVDRVQGHPVNSFNRLILRNSGNDSPHTRFRDAFNQTLLQPLGLDYQAWQPAIHFINGEYWGLINIRERIDANHIANHYHMDPEEVVILHNNAALDAGSEEDQAGYLAFRDYVATRDMADPEHFRHVKELMDVRNFMLYQIGQIYIRNRDWPGNNIMYWRKRGDRTGFSDLPGHDGRWRWILVDTDFGHGGDASHDTLTFATAVGGQHWPNPDWSTILLRHLLSNPTFKQSFINAFADHLNTSFQPRRAKGLVDAMHAAIELPLHEHVARWRFMGNTNPAFLRTFADQRPAWMRHLLARFFALVDEIPGATLFVEPFESWSDGIPDGWIKGASLHVEPGRATQGTSCLRMKGAGLGDNPALLLSRAGLLADIRHSTVRISGSIKRIAGTGEVRIQPRFPVLASLIQLVPESRWQTFSETVVLDWRAGNGDLTISATAGLEFLLDDLRIEEVHIPDATAIVTLNVSDPAHGHLQINTIQINQQTPGLPNTNQPYPWSGLYFQAVPITVTALPAAGYRFDRWEEYPDLARSTIEILPDQDLQLTARFETLPPAPPAALLHYWSFNDPERLTDPAYSIGGGELQIAPGATTEVVAGSGQGFTGQNTRLGQPAGSHLRVNDPLGSTLTFAIPTTGFQEIQVRYETRRSGQGAGTQEIAYSIDGIHYVPFTSLAVFDIDPVLHTIDFTGVDGAQNNPDFLIRITFAEESGGTAGNNRFDNLTVEGRPHSHTVNSPPFHNPLPARLDLIRNDTPTALNLNALFVDPDSDGLLFLAQSSRPGVADLFLNGSLLQIHTQSPGDAWITIRADDGHHPPVPVSLRVVVHPEPHPLVQGPFVLQQWHPNQPAGSYPPHMVFEQTAASDPDLETGMDSYWTLPYDLTSRSRITGLGDLGIGFINTANPQDLPEAGYLGSALVALCTVGVGELWISWTGGTVLPNDRVYGLRLQYRVGHSDPWSDVLDEWGFPVEYVSHPAAGHANAFEPVRLPADAAAQDHVQIRWTYHHISGDTGPRAHLRLDDVFVVGRPPNPITITRQPDRQVVVQNGAVTFRVEVDGPEPLTYQWLHNGAPMPDVEGPILTIAPALLADAGTYHVVVIGPGGGLESEPAHLTVIDIQQNRDASSSQPTILVAGPPGNRYRIMATDSLLPPVQWHPLLRLTTGESIIEILDDGLLDGPFRFYQIVPLSEP